MITERDVELAHPEAFDFIWGNLPPAERAEFNRHLSSCPHCQRVVDEYSEIGRIIKDLPPHVEPPADLEDRTVAAMVAAMAEERAPDRQPDTEDQAATKLYPLPEVQPPAEPDTKIQPRPQFQPPAEDEARVQPRPQFLQPPAETQARPMVNRLPVWRRYRGRLAAVVAAAAAVIIAAIAIPLSLLGSGATTVAIPLSATAVAKVSGFGAATGRATARQDASGSWDITLTVQHLKSFGDAQWYECWYIGFRSGQRQVAPAGSFLVSDGGSRTFTMTSAVDPNEFKMMVITLQPPSANGAFRESNVILSGQTL
jgi:Putative zinc-finger